jgi:hypothetical protein
MPCFVTVRPAIEPSVEARTSRQPWRMTQQRDRVGGHRGAPVGVDAQLAAGDALLGAGRRDELLGQDGGLTGGDHPADHVPGVDVQDHVQVVVGPFRRAVQLGDVPGLCRQALRRCRGPDDTISSYSSMTITVRRHPEGLVGSDAL